MSRKTRGLALPFLVLLTVSATAGCDGNGSDSLVPAAATVTELDEVGFGEYLGAQAPSRTETDGAWTHLFYDPAERGATCLVGDEFQISFRDGPSDDVLLFLQGGGACWDFLTCHVLNTATVRASGPALGGSLDINNPDSPFRDFDIVYVPYCDGSVFTGDATVFYNDVETFHHGLRNLTVAVDAIVENFPDPNRILVAGSSAGGYGTFAGYAVSRVAFPDTRIIVFNDAGPGVQNTAASEDVISRVENWDFLRFIPPTCTECDPQFTFLADWILERDPGTRFAMYSTQQDNVISFFIDLDGPAYRDLLVSVTDEINARHPDRFKRFFPADSEHTVLQRGTYYERQIGDVQLAEWTRGFLSDDEAWVDVVE